MKEKIISILLISIILFSCSNENKRYHIDETTSPNDTLTYLKSDMSLLNGIVFGEFGEFGKYVDGIKDGIHKEWYESGQILLEETYKLGDKNFNGFYRKYWFENGQLMGQGSYTGEYIEYYDNGKIAKKGNLINGKLVGIHKTYYGSNGKLMIETDKKNNIMKMWDKKGNLIYEGEYDSVKSGSFYFDNYYVTDY